MILRYKISLVAVKPFEDHGINVDRAEFLSLSIIAFMKDILFVHQKTQWYTNVLLYLP